MPLDLLRDWTYDSDEDSAGVVGAVPKQPAAGSAAKRKATLVQSGASGSRSAGKKLVHRKKCATSPSSVDPLSRPRKI